jgi:hypothetical protein
VRPKAAYKAQVADGDLSFTLYLADRLKMTAAQLLASMSNEEYVHWQMWHGRRAQEMQLAQQRKG